MKKPAVRGIICLLLGLFCPAFIPFLHFAGLFRVSLKYKYGNRHFWCRGYYVDTVGRNEKAISEYVKNQLQEDIASDQISIKEYMDPFTGEPVNKGK